MAMTGTTWCKGGWRCALANGSIRRHAMRDALSPISHDFKSLAPLYLQAGGREILYDMIGDFARKQAQNGAVVLLDVWPNMPHDFQLLDSTQRSATEALARIRAAVRNAVDRDEKFQAGTMTEVSSGGIWKTPTMK
jgi:epsilon-lactone hydrolase